MVMLKIQEFLRNRLNIWHNPNLKTKWLQFRIFEAFKTFFETCIEKKKQDFSILRACSLSLPHHTLLPCRQLCTHYDQNTPLTMSRLK